MALPSCRKCFTILISTSVPCPHCGAEPGDAERGDLARVNRRRSGLLLAGLIGLGMTPSVACYGLPPDCVDEDGNAVYCSDPDATDGSTDAESDTAESDGSAAPDDASGASDVAPDNDGSGT